MVLKNKIFFLFLSLSAICYSQKVEILGVSGFKHNYVVGNLEYIEDIKDTARLKYIATLKVEDKTFYWTGIVIHWLDGIQTVSRKIGANSFCIEKYSGKDSIATLIVKVYFASMKFLSENELKRSRNNIILFSAFTNLEADSFYLNKTKKYIDPKKHFLITTSLNEEYNLGVNKLIAPNKVLFKKEKSSKFFIIPDKKATTVTGKVGRNPSNKGVNAVSLPLVGVVGVILMNVGKNSLIELSYRDGRFMSDIFK